MSVNVREIAKKIANHSFRLEGKSYKLSAFIRVQPPSTNGNRNNNRNAGTSPTIVLDVPALERALGRPVSLMNRLAIACHTSEAAIEAFGTRTDSDGKLVFNPAPLTRMRQNGNQMVRVEQEDRLEQGQAIYYQPASNNLMGWMNGAGRNDEATKAFVDAIGYLTKDAPAAATQAPVLDPAGLDNDAFAAWAMAKTQDDSILSLLDTLEGAPLRARVAIKKEIISAIEGATQATQGNPPATQGSTTSTPATEAPTGTTEQSVEAASSEIPF